MDMQRRLLLKSIALSGVSGWLGWIAPGAASAITASQTLSVRPAGLATILLVNRKAECSVFLQGARIAGNTNMEIYDLDSEQNFLASLQHYLGKVSTEKRVIAGLVDDACGTLIIDQARSRGACVRWLGQHTVESGQSRHLLYSSELTGGDGGPFGHQLASRGYSCISERNKTGTTGQSLYEPVLYTREGGTEDLRWNADLGFALMTGNSLADFPDISQINRDPIAPLIGHFVSFAFEI